MILSGVADCYTATATTTATTTGNATMMMANLPPAQQQQEQQEATTDFWWWTNQQTDGGVAGHQHQQISSSSSQLQQQQQQQQIDGDDFDGFDLSLLINGSNDGYFSDSTSDCRVPAAAISATVTVHANAALDSMTDGNDYYPSTTMVTAQQQQQQQQLDIQQLLSIYDDICFFSNDAPENDVKPIPIFHRDGGVPEDDDVKPVAIFHQEPQRQQLLATSTVTTTTNNTGARRPSKSSAGPAAVVPNVITTTTTTATTVADNTSNVAANKTTLLRSLLTVSAMPLPAAISLPEKTLPGDSTAIVESTTEVTMPITTTTNDRNDGRSVTSAAGDNGNKASKHRLLIEMLRGASNDDVVVPTSAVRPARRRPRSAAFGTDDDEPSSYSARRRLYSPESPMDDDGQDVQQDDVNGDALLLYGGTYLSAAPASPSWLDNMVAAAANTVADNGNFYPCATTSTTDCTAADQRQDVDRRRDQPAESRDNIVDDCCAGTDYCNDYDAIGNGVFDQRGTMDGGYYSTAATEIAYSPPTAAQVPSVTPPPTSCGDPSTTTTADDMVQSMCWKSDDTSDDYYDSLLMTVMMEAAAATPTNEDANCGSPENIGSSSISSSCSTSSVDSCNSNSNSCGYHSGDRTAVSSKISSVDSGCDDTTAIDSDDSDCTLVQLQLHRPAQAIDTSATSTKATTPVAVKPTKSTSTTTTTTAPSSSQHIHLWQFLKELLATAAAAEQTSLADNDNAAHQHNGSPLSPASSTSSCPGDYNNSGASPAVRPTNAAGNQQQQMIRWLDRKEGVFKIEDSQAVARLWGLRKNRPLMNYDKLSRSLRQYYKKGIMRKTVRSQRLVYQFCHPYNA